MAKKKKKRPGTITNRQAKYNYSIENTFIAGIVLSGAEVKALRLGYGQLTGSYITIKDNELFLINSLISGSNQIKIEENAKTKPRKLLAKRREIDQLTEAKTQGRTIIPLEFITHGKYIKLKIAIGKGKKRYDKRQALKARSEQRQINRAVKSHTVVE